MNLDLAPFAAVIDWQFPSRLTPDAWEGLAAGYMETLANKVVQTGPVVIGHIKGFATFQGGGFLRASVISANRPVDSELEGQVGETDQLSFTLNMLVYGLPFEQAESIAREQAEQVAGERGGKIHFQYTADQAHTSHHHHNQGENHD